MGFGIGYGGNIFKEESRFVSPARIENESASKTFGGVDYGFVVGYKQFFTPHLGLRYYGSVNLNHSKVGGDKVDLINYSANVDFLGNFIVTEMIDFGGFIGLGIGGNSWMGKAIDGLEDELNQIANNLNASSVSTEITKSSIDLALNIGLRVNVAYYHGMELVARVPVLWTDLAKLDASGAGASLDLSGKIIHRYSVMLRYVVSF